MVGTALSSVFATQSCGDIRCLTSMPDVDASCWSVSSGIRTVAGKVALEGQISRAALEASLSRGHRASGDMIPWTLSQQYQDGQFASLSGARIVRIATHYDVQKVMGPESYWWRLERRVRFSWGLASGAMDVDDEPGAFGFLESLSVL